MCLNTFLPSIKDVFFMCMCVVDGETKGKCYESVMRFHGGEGWRLLTFMEIVVEDEKKKPILFMEKQKKYDSHEMEPIHESEMKRDPIP